MSGWVVVVCGGGVIIWLYWTQNFMTLSTAKQFAALALVHYWDTTAVMTAIMNIGRDNGHDHGRDRGRCARPRLCPRSMVETTVIIA